MGRDELSENQLAELRRYVEEKGFKKGDTWYFRTSWMNPQFRDTLERSGIVKRAGTIFELRKNGLQFPETINPGRGVQRAIIYQTSDIQLNSVVNI